MPEEDEIHHRAQAKLRLAKRTCPKLEKEFGLKIVDRD